MNTDGDVLLEQTPDKGDITFIDGQPNMTGGFETAAYLSLFGGNAEDDGSPDNPKTYWGNLTETDPAERQISRTQFLLRGLPATSSNLLRVQEAAELDLQWFRDERIADEIEVEVSIPALNRVDILVSITAQGKQENFKFTENWKAQQANG